MYCIIHSVKCFLGSDGFLYSSKLYAGSNQNDFPGKQLTEITLVNLEKKVTIIQLSSDCIGLYGAEVKGDGKFVYFSLHFKWYEVIIYQIVLSLIIFNLFIKLKFVYCT